MKCAVIRKHGNDISNLEIVERESPCATGENIRVRVTATADVRGSMAMDPAVPVGFQAMSCDVMFSVKAGTPPALIEKLEVAAKRCCVVQQTLKAPPIVATTFLDSGP